MGCYLGGSIVCDTSSTCCAAFVLMIHPQYTSAGSSVKYNEVYCGCTINTNAAQQALNVSPTSCGCDVQLTIITDVDSEGSCHFAGSH